MAAVTVCSDFGAQENSLVTVSIVSPTLCHEVMGLDPMILVFWMILSFWMIQNNTKWNKPGIKRQILWNHLYAVPKGVKFTERERRVVTWDWQRVNGEIGIEFQFGETTKFWGWMVVQNNVHMFNGPEMYTWNWFKCYVHFITMKKHDKWEEIISAPIIDKGAK